MQPLLEKLVGVKHLDNAATPREYLELLIRQWECGRSLCSPSWQGLLDVLKEMSMESVGFDIAAFLGKRNL
jgi:hypothetical protein